MQTPIMHWFGATQSAAVWQGKAHFENWVLQWCRPQVASLWQGSARRPGVDIWALAAGAGAGAVGAGAGAYVGAGAGAGAYVGAGA